LEHGTDGVVAAPVRAPSPTAPAPQPVRMQAFKDAVTKLIDLDAPLFCDVQMLQSTEGDVIKEFSVTTDWGPTAWTLVRPPPLVTPKRLPNEYLRIYEHGIPWDDGDADLCQLEEMTRDLFQRGGVKIFMKGHEKARLLVQQLKVNFESIHLLDHAPRLTTLRGMFPSSAQCPFHGRSQMLCAVRNAHALLGYVMSQP